MTIGEYRRSSKLLLIALLYALLLMLLSTLTVHAATVSIDDQAKVLDQAKVQTEAAKLPRPVVIYTTRIFVGEQDAFNQTTRLRLPNQGTIAVGIDVVHHHLSIQSGTEVKLSDSQANDAIDAFKENYNDGDYTGATLASINSLHDALTGAGDRSWLETAIIMLLCLGIPGAIIFFVVRNRSNRNKPPYNGGRRNRDYNAAYFTGSHSNMGYYGGSHSGGGSSFGGGAGGSFGGGGGGGGSF